MRLKRTFGASNQERGKIRTVLGIIRKPDPFDVANYGLLVAFAAALIYYLQLDTMRRQLSLMEADMRPYVGLDKIVPQGVNPANNHEVILGTLKNFGKNPAFQTDAEWEVIVNGVARPGMNGPRKQLTLFPSVEYGIQIDVTPEHWQKITAGDDTLQVRVTARYRDATKQRQYDYCEQQRYYPANGVFLSEGC